MTPGSPIGDAGVIDRDAGIIALVCTVLHAFGRSPILVVSVICGRYAVSPAGGLDGFGRHVGRVGRFGTPRGLTSGWSEWLSN